MKDYRELVDYLKKNSVEPIEAMEIFKKALTINPENYRTRWKMFRFTIYLWARIEEDKKGRLDKKINTIRKLVASTQYQNMYKTVPFGAFNQKKTKSMIFLTCELRAENKIVATASGVWKILNKKLSRT